MSSLALIAFARAIHILAGVGWAGAAFVLANVVLPLAARHGREGAGRWMGMVAQHAGRMAGIAAMLTVLSGIYLFVVLHPNDTSSSGLVLMSGAAAALLSLAVGLFVNRPAGLRMQKLNSARAEGQSPPPEAQQEIASLMRRAQVGARVAAALLALSVLAMATFRYVAF